MSEYRWCPLIDALLYHRSYSLRPTFYRLKFGHCLRGIDSSILSVIARNTKIQTSTKAQKPGQSPDSLAKISEIIADAINWSRMGSAMIIRDDIQANVYQRQVVIRKKRTRIRSIFVTTPKAFSKVLEARLYRNRTAFISLLAEIKLNHRYVHA